jgi:hypothetical protein
MAIELSIPNAKEIAPGVWEAAIGPRDMRAFDGSGTTVGHVSVILLQEPFDFEQGRHILRFPLDAARALNVGSTPKAIVIAAKSGVAAATGPLDPEPLGRGDKSFIHALAVLPLELKAVGEELLKGVRAQSAGDLRPLSNGLRFQETPDNFWFVTIQPRDKSLSIVVRGLPNHFATTRLKVVEDRRPYSRFKIKSMADLADAVAVVLSAVRRKR